MPSVELVTGFPGFIGERLVAALLEARPESRVVALVEERMAHQARSAAGGIDPERIEVVPGDITEGRLGLDRETYDRLAADVTGVFHLAAVYDLEVPLGTAEKVNIEGTANLLEFCGRCERLERLDYVSTAYVAGLRRGLVFEHELALGQGFKNHYESTKFQAEVWVRSMLDRLPVTIHRPAIVVGDSSSGETQKFDGPYYVLRAIAQARRLRIPIAQFGAEAAPFNVVPVDFVVNALVAAGNDAASVGKTLHLVDPEPLSAASLVVRLAQEYAGRTPAFRLPSRLAAKTLRIPPVRRLLGDVPPESIEYLNHPVRFDTRTARAVLEPQGVRCPPFEDYVGPLVRFFRAHEEDPAYA